ncbi:MAG: hypothetical protein A3E83_07150 [Gammaproteobacteria bacterium RIFCSPHIGHO2_12_FULL_41_20]|nr:MAG: hypothetical protein A3E83_07150 [Gammaproteobacteria bacterium RIFCSPHIGHO2_12_FULL_41_20]
MMHKQLGQPQAATIIQKHFRGQRARRLYTLYPLKPEQQTHEIAFLIGNDPVIEGLESFQAKQEQIALIATSGMRALLLVCQLADNAQKSRIPNPKQDIEGYFKNLFACYSYDYIRTIILFTSFISQTWEDSSTFCKIRNILGLLGINQVYVYASNIICNMPENCRLQILQNIALLQPRLSIHTDLSLSFLTPERVYLVEDPQPSMVHPLLKPT